MRSSFSAAIVPRILNGMRRDEVDPAVETESPAPLHRDRVVLRTRKSPAFWYCALGLLALGATFLIPAVTARRTARAESRGDVLAELLLREASAMPFLPLDADWAQALVLARLGAAASAHGVYVADLELLPRAPAAPAITMHNKHYVLQLRRSAPPTGPAEGATGVGGHGLAGARCQPRARCSSTRPTPSRLFAQPAGRLRRHPGFQLARVGRAPARGGQPDLWSTGTDDLSADPVRSTDTAPAGLTARARPDQSLLNR
jgi:hypothetical protein